MTDKKVDDMNREELEESLYLRHLRSMVKMVEKGDEMSAAERQAANAFIRQQNIGRDYGPGDEEEKLEAEMQEGHAENYKFKAEMPGVSDEEDLATGG